MPRKLQITAAVALAVVFTTLPTVIGWTQDELSNHLLTETLDTFANRNSGAFEGFLGVIYYPDRALDRITQMTWASFNGCLPDYFKSEIFEYADGRFDFRIDYERPHPNWKPFPNPIKQEEVSIDLGTWTTDKRTGKAIERQDRLMGRTPADYIRHIIGSTLAGDDKDTVLTDDRRIVCGSEVAFDGDGIAQDL